MTTREKVMVSGLVIVCAIGSFLWFYLIPQLDNLDQLRRSVAAQEIANSSAQVRTMGFRSASNQLYGSTGTAAEPEEGSLYYEWQYNMTNIVDDFDRVETMRAIETLITPRVAQGTAVSITFGDTRGLGILEVHPTSVSFSAANRIALMNILDSFYTFPIENRIVNYSISSRGDGGSLANGELSVVLSIEFLSQAS